MDASKKIRVLVTVVAAVMVLSALSAFFNAPGESGNTTAAAGNQVLNVVNGDNQNSPTPTAQPLDEATVLKLLSEYNIPTKYAYLPNFNFNGNATSSVEPMYERSPAPIGVSDYGYSTTSGVISTYSYTTSGFLGSFMFEGMDPFYLQNNDPGTVAIQLNSVLNHVTVQGNSNYVFWVQNVIVFTPGSHSMQFVSNIWSFSTTDMVFPNNAILSGNGAVVPGLFYYYAGPVISNLPDTFTAIVYTDSTMSGLNNALDFKYEITGTESSSTVPLTTYDTVVFNSVLPGTTTPAPAANFYVNGNARTPSGYLYDSELVVTGPGGGSTSTIYAANDQLKLQHKDTTGSYVNSPAAYNFGSNTGETIQGLSSWWTSVQSPVVHLSLGPSILTPMWGSDITRSGATNVQGNLDPPNAFMFISSGTTFDSSHAAWAPVNANGSFVYALPGGIDYSASVMMSEFQPQTFNPMFAEEETNETEGGGPPNGTGGGGGGDENETASYFNVTLTFDKSVGIYTPLYANGNDQIGYLTLGNSNITGPISANVTMHHFVGTGEPGDPYLIENNQHQQLNKLFSQANGFMFPVFSGILLMNTNASVQIDNPSSFAVQFMSYMAPTLSYYNLPFYNNLNYMFYNTSSVVLFGAQAISGWFGSTLSGMPAASVMFWDSTDFLVGGNHFSTMSNAILVHNENGVEANGTIWGNYFMQDHIGGSSYANGILNGTDPIGIMMLSSGNLIYNNYFDLQTSAYSPSKDIFTNTSATYSNAWDIGSKQPLSYYKIVQGHNLTDAIVQVSYQGGNYWSSFDGSIPFNDGGNIAVGGDNYPLIVPKYDITFTGTGLAPGLSWSVTLDDHTVSTTAASLTLQAENGTHTFKIGKPQNYMATPVSGVAIVAGETIIKTITFSLIEYQVTFMQTGQPAGLIWSVNLNGDVKTSTGNAISYMKDNGTYDYYITGHSHYTATPSAGTILVYGADATESVTFVNTTYSIVFIVSGLPSGSHWGATVNGVIQTTDSSTMHVMRTNGTYTYSIAPPAGYNANPSNGTLLLLGSDVTIEVQFTEKTYPVQFEVKGLPSGMEWGVTFDGQDFNTTTSSISFDVVNGAYNYSVATVSGYTAQVSGENVTVSDQGVTVVVQYQQNPNHLLTAGLMSGGAAAGIGAGLILAYMLWRKPPT